MVEGERIDGGALPAAILAEFGVSRGCQIIRQVRRAARNSVCWPGENRLLSPVAPSAEGGSSFR
jgi:hypothetical protein